MKYAFSLVELSIVLVILGLLTGGILAGQSLIRAAELRSISTDISRYLSASMAFRDKYFGLPGDFNKATTFWGNATTGTTGGECTNPESDAGTDTQTCNGNGDGLIAASGGDNLRNSELFRYWQHLKNAGLVEGNYSGVASNTPTGGTNWRIAVPGTNVPASKLSNAGIFIVTQAINTNGHPWTGGDAATLRTWMYIGAATVGDVAWGNILKPEEIWNLDVKMDDGKPGTGTVRPHAAQTNCVTTNVAPSSEYLLTSSSTGCTPVIDTKL